MKTINEVRQHICAEKVYDDNQFAAFLNSNR